MDIHPRIPNLSVEDGLEDCTDSQFEGLSTVLYKHDEDLRFVSCTYYPPENGKHSQLWVTMVTETDEIQYCISARGKVSTYMKGS